MDLDDCKRVRRNPHSRSVLRSPAASQRITQLEVELSLLRSQLAELIVRQERKNVPCGTSGETAARADADGQSDGCDSQSVIVCAAEPEKRLPPSTQQSTVIPTVPVTIPKPPPLPPSFPCASFSKPTGDDWRARLIAKRKGNSEVSYPKIPGIILAAYPEDNAISTSNKPVEISSEVFLDSLSPMLIRVKPLVSKGINSLDWRIAYFC